MQHDGATIIVTGAGSGVGRATAHRLAREGASVIAVDVVGDAVTATVEAIGGAATAVVADVGNREDVARIVAVARERGGRIDGLVNNAAILDRILPADECDDDTWERVLRVDLTGPFMLCREVLPLMMAQRAGAIVNISSVAGIRGARGGVAYTAAKHGIIGLSKSIAANYMDDGIRCNAVCPGGVNTGIGSRDSGPRSPKGAEVLARTMPQGWGHIAEPEELADVISFLLSHDARNINGAVIVADGGWTMV